MVEERPDSSGTPVVSVMVVDDTVWLIYLEGSVLQERSDDLYWMSLCV